MGKSVPERAFFLDYCSGTVMFLCDDVFALAQANDRLIHMQLGVNLSFAMWYTSVAFEYDDLHAKWREWFPDLAPASDATVQDKVLWSGPVAEAVTGKGRRECAPHLSAFVRFLPYNRVLQGVLGPARALLPARPRE